MTREPQNQGPPACYSLWRAGDDRCLTCPHVHACRACTSHYGLRRTLRQAADAATRSDNAVAAATPEDLVGRAQATWLAAGGHARGWGCDQRWMRAAQQVIASCASSGIDPRVYVDAQLSMVVPFCKERRFPLHPGMLVGPRAAARFRRWAEQERLATGKPAGMAPTAEDPETAALSAGEREFALRYLQSPGLRAREVEAEVQREHPHWSLAQTAGMAGLRLQALCGAAAALDPTAPDRLMVPADGEALGWPEMRRAVLDVFAAEDQPT